ncbi:MAG: FHA domain-containing protein [Nitriliruptorales bacterium]|nr:FHA domain-containing protein [Nitriliruptorales bacterium]
MFCTQCGQQLPDGANFCSACGAPTQREESKKAVEEVTTAAIDVGAFDQHEQLEDVPDLEPGTGMLVVVRGPNAGSRFLIDRDSTTIGRHPDSHIFLDDVTVSRRHAEVEREEGTMRVSDLGSLNGTYVNGERVEEQDLTTGDEVQIGRFKLMYVGAQAT